VKARYALWPIGLFAALSIASACSSDGSSSDNPASGGDATAEGGGVSTGATNSAGATDGGGLPGMEAGAPGTSLGGASGGVSATAGAGGGAGGAVDLCEGKELSCADDNNPCTEDECNPATGECGIPRSETACDDGVYCNGADTCDAGECSVHEGNPCSGTCNEAGKYCECASADDCPADEPGEWGACGYESTCDEAATQSRPVTKYSCNNVGKCVGTAVVENMPCTRDTDGTVCETDNNRCNGTEKCKAGACVPDNVDPCAGNASNPYCYNGDPTCRVCKSSNLNGSNPVGCSSGMYCCGGSCQSTSCLVIVTTLVTTLATKIGP
jgi:hypothetical protein